MNTLKKKEKERKEEEKKVSAVVNAYPSSMLIEISQVLLNKGLP